MEASGYQPGMRKTPVSHDLAARLRPFTERGLVTQVPTEWQLMLGQLEMAPYVVMPDAGDVRRYDGARLGHPLLRTPIVIAQIGWEHFRVGHGLHSSMEALERHLAYVFHEGMPVYDLQLVQTHAGGLGRLRAFLEQVDAAATPEHGRHRRLIDLIIPNARAYRAAFTAPGGWIDQAAAFDFPAADATPTFLRPEFTSLVRFLEYCTQTFPPSARGEPPLQVLRTVAELATRRWRNAA